MRFKAVADPPGAPWPSGYPTWSGSATSGTGETKDGTFSPPVGAGSRTVTVSCGNSKTASIGVISNPTLPVAKATVGEVNPTTFRNVMPSDDRGFTDVETLNISITACHDGTKWHAIVTDIGGTYSIRTRLSIPGVVTTDEVIPPLDPETKTIPNPATNTTLANSCAQISNLKATSHMATTWYMIGAVDAHERVHAEVADDALAAQVSNIESTMEGLFVDDTGQTQAQAIAAIKAQASWKTTVDGLIDDWHTEWDNNWLIEQHGPGDVVTTSGPDRGATYTAEANYVQSTIDAINKWRISLGQGLSACP